MPTQDSVYYNGFGEATMKYSCRPVVLPSKGHKLPVGLMVHSESKKKKKYYFHISTGYHKE